MSKLTAVKNEITHILSEKLIPFWLERSVDTEFGGYLTCFDEKGEFTGNDTKYLVTQSRMVWGFSNLLEFAREEDKEAMKAAAKQGARFLMEKFWDEKYGGFYWQLNRDGSIADPAKLVYGEGFAIYALSEYAHTYGDSETLAFAEKGFDLLQLYAADTLRGGYYENIDQNWEISPAGAYAGDRKSLDIHMHLVETFTTLYKATGKEIHGRKLKEVLDLVFRHMINREKGYGYNQFDLEFNQLPAINILRTWNAERETNEVVETPTDTTSYGHNVELSWLSDLAIRTLGCDRTEYEATLQKLLDHALKHGFDYENGGVYRDGVADESVLVYDKEWWQNFESMVGFLNGYCMYGEEKYLEAFLLNWDFVKKYFLIEGLGESRQLLSRDGSPIISNIGNPWKGIYHTGRALGECLRRMAILENK
ncbi:MAG: AGE family epimerase/isomerase [Christensenellaceae bacterium]|nr:AGE family epimerase/isomerase [Christensenellaceae bacterium]